jgi:hypothetical protein
MGVQIVFPFFRQYLIPTPRSSVSKHCWCDSPEGMEFHDPNEPHRDHETGRPMTPEEWEVCGERWNNNHTYSKDRPAPPVKLCEKCGEVLDNPDPTLDLKFSSPPDTTCGSHLISLAAERLENESASG